ncbi:hypothetical protein FM038_001345 [Shewanella eurypsychrophilus]|uniref:Uncharacterized protein n=1 Tax=Shewanella eurypsychrophilus TaxID=2593656 RepID=A0ABX6V0S2_9GAMM|nr:MULTISPECIES: hypothetical protein [Shewanella]QFU20653.1 hypothetical protein FS418_01325 [Shewanella sp. YLB-09]QFU20933.1 hypothetical protein FS418_02935 [Shewanella sp. YLB-09]QPG56221.1 hypothetical protein FM038_001345 [Shewanella eurypsychrophilus]
MKKTSLAVTILMTLSISINAEEHNISNRFQHEANLTYADDLGDDGSTLWQLNYRYYLDKVDSGKAPTHSMVSWRKAPT